MRNVDDQLIESVFSLSRFMKENMTFNCELATLTLLQVQTILYLHKNPHAQMSEIAVQFKIEMPTATSLIQTLCKSKLTERHEDTHDRRIVRISLTTQGNTLLETIRKERSKKLQKMFAYLSHTEKSDLLRIIHKLIEHSERINIA